MISDDQLLPLRYLNDFLFCERRVAMHLIERIWVDNQFTTEGIQSHRIVDKERNLKRGDKRNITAMWVVSRRLGLIGKTDLVELHNGVPYPVDFKRGKLRRWDNNEVQLCAQALCLEEMLDVHVPLGAIFPYQESTSPGGRVQHCASREDRGYRQTTATTDRVVAHTRTQVQGTLSRLFSDGMVPAEGVSTSSNCNQIS